MATDQQSDLCPILLAIFRHQDRTGFVQILENYGKVLAV